MDPLPHLGIAVGDGPLAVIPVLMGPLQVLLALLPAIAAAFFGLVLAFFRPSAYRGALRFFWHQKLFTACLIAVGACWWTGFPLSLLPTRAGTADGAGAGDWPSYRGGPARLGRAPGHAGAQIEPTAGGLIWSALRGLTLYSSPTVAGDRVYVSTVSDISPFNPTGKGAIVCLDAHSGQELWRYAPGDFRGTFSSPVVKDSRLVCGEGLHQTADARVTCLDLAGRRIWELRTKSHVESTPCIEGGRVYVGAAADGVYCIDLAPDDKGQPVIHWHLDPAKYVDCESSPLVVDGVCYFGLGDGGAAICAVDARTGEERWRVPTPYPVFPAPTVVGGRLYVAMGNGNYALTAEELLAAKKEELKAAGKSPAEIEEATKHMAPGGALWCLDVRAGNVLWKHPLPDTVLGAVACENDRVYCGCRDGRLYCLSTEGKPLGHYDARGPIFGSPALGRRHVYFPTKDGRVFCLRADSLEPVWDAALGSEVWGSPALAHGHLYVGTVAGLRSVGSDLPPLPPRWVAGERGGLVGREAIAREVEQAWRYPAEEQPPFVVTSPLMSLGEFAYAAGLADRKPEAKLDGDSHAGPQLLKLSAVAGAQEDQHVLWAKPLKHAVDLPLAGLGERLLFVEGGVGRREALRCLLAEKGDDVWSLKLAAAAPGHFTIDRDRAYVWTGNEELAAVDIASGQMVWRMTTDVGAAVGSPAVAADLLLAAGAAGVAAYDAPTGTRLWRASVTSSPHGAALPLGTNFLMAVGDRLELRRLADGSLVWQSSVGDFDHPLVADGGHAAVCTRAGELKVVSLADGQVVRTVPCEPGRWPPLVHQGTVVFRQKERWSAISLAHAAEAAKDAAANIVGKSAATKNAAAKPWEWFITFGGDVRPSMPIIGSASALFIADEKGGVVCVRPTR